MLFIQTAPGQDRDNASYSELSPEPLISQNMGASSDFQYSSFLTVIVVARITIALWWFPERHGVAPCLCLAQLEASHASVTTVAIPFLPPSFGSFSPFLVETNIQSILKCFKTFFSKNLRKLKVNVYLIRQMPQLWKLHTKIFSRTEAPSFKEVK